jgi:hypothetical protein
VRFKFALAQDNPLPIFVNSCLGCYCNIYIFEAFDKQLRAILPTAVAQDDSLSVFVNGYLRFHKRAYDAEELTTPAADVGVSGAERALLQRRVFMVLYRM